MHSVAFLNLDQAPLPFLYLLQWLLYCLQLGVLKYKGKKRITFTTAVQARAVADMNALETRATLLYRLRDTSDQEAWRQFASIYTPLVYQYALKNGLQDADAADVAQETMCNVVRVICDFEYDPNRGSFRGWLLTVVRNSLRKRFRLATNQSCGSGDTAVHELLHQTPDTSFSADAAWDREYELWLFHKVANWIKTEFQSKTWDAFWKTTVDGLDVNTVAKELSMTCGAIYIARSRVLTRIRSEIERIESWEVT